MTSQYEVVVLYHPSLEVDLSKGEERVLKIFKDNNAKVIKTDNWGKRKLAYKIKGNEHAIYMLYILEVEGANVAKIDSTLNITDEVIRFLITKIDHKAMEKAEKAKALKLEQASKRDAINEAKQED